MARSTRPFQRLKVQSKANKSSITTAATMVKENLHKEYYLVNLHEAGSDHRCQQPSKVENMEPITFPTAISLLLLWMRKCSPPAPGTGSKCHDGQSNDHRWHPQQLRHGRTSFYKKSAPFTRSTKPTTNKIYSIFLCLLLAAIPAKSLLLSSIKNATFCQGFPQLFSICPETEFRFPRCITDPRSRPWEMYLPLKPEHRQ